MAEHFHPQVEDGFLSDPLGQVGAGVLHEAAYDKDAQIQEHRHQQPLFVPFGDVDVDRQLGKVRAHRFQAADEQAQNDADADLQPVGTQIPEQAPHEARIVCFTEDLFFLHQALCSIVTITATHAKAGVRNRRATSNASCFTVVVLSCTKAYSSTSSCSNN